jgi:hypothetical protein
MSVGGSRPDISDHLIHFTRGEDWNDAFERFDHIVAECVLRGSNGTIRGGYNCVCFTEAPIHSLSDGLVDADEISRYMPFGIMFEKAWIYERGCRPAIYQAEAEFEQLPEQLRWRHVRYEPPAVDFTWEREWRIQTNELQFDPFCAALIVPDGQWIDRLLNRHAAAQNIRAYEYDSLLGDGFGEWVREPYEWRVASLR